MLFFSIYDKKNNEKTFQNSGAASPGACERLAVLNGRTDGRSSAIIRGTLVEDRITTMSSTAAVNSSAISPVVCYRRFSRSAFFAESREDRPY